MIALLYTQAGCLHQVYTSTGGRYRLLRSYYGPGATHIDAGRDQALDLSMSALVIHD